MHTRLIPILFVTACATVSPLTVRVTGDTARTGIALMAPGQFDMPIAGSDLWIANHACSRILSQEMQLGMIDFRELDLPADRRVVLANFTHDSNVKAVAERTGQSIDRVLMVQPTVSLSEEKRRIKQNGTPIQVKAATFRIGLRLWMDGETAGEIMLHRKLEPIDYAVLEDPMSVWLPALESACSRLAAELKGSRSNKVPPMPQLRENLASMAATSRPDAAGVTGIVDPIRRLGELQRMLSVAGYQISGSEADRAVNLPMGVTVVADYGLLKAGDTIIMAQQSPVRSVHTITRMLDAGVVHVEVLRDGKQIPLTLEPR